MSNLCLPCFTIESRSSDRVPISGFCFIPREETKLVFPFGVPSPNAVSITESFIGTISPHSRSSNKFSLVDRGFIILNCSLVPIQLVRHLHAWTSLVTGDESSYWPPWKVRLFSLKEKKFLAEERQLLNLF